MGVLEYTKGQQTLLGKLVGGTGKIIQNVGSKLGLGQIVPGGFGAQLQILGRQLNPVKEVKASDNVLGLGTTNTSGSYYPNSLNNYGNPLNTNLGGTGGGNLSGSAGGTTTTDNGGSVSTGDPYADLRRSYDYARGIYEQQFPQLEGDYNKIKGDIEGAVGRAKETLVESKEDINRGFGENLRNLITNSQELGQKTRNIYSGLNALDSSSYADAQIKQEQGLYDTQGKLEAEKLRSNKEADRAFADYESKATSDLSTLGKQYLAGKQALQQAIADNNIEEANTILGHMQNLGSLITNAKLGLAQLQASGTDVVGALKQLNRGGVDNIFGNYLSSIYQPSMANLNIGGNSQNVGSGYISPKTGKRYSSYNDYLRSEA